VILPPLVFPALAITKKFFFQVLTNFELKGGGGSREAIDVCGGSKGRERNREGGGNGKF
jgi:hypothetical protein